MTDWTRAELPAGAPLVDRLTFPVWRLWKRSLRHTLRHAFRIALAISVVVGAVLLVTQAAFFGPWGTGAAAVVVGAVAIGWFTRRRSHWTSRPRRAGSRIVAVLLALPLAYLMVMLISISTMIITSIVIVPAANHGLPAFILIAAGATVIGLGIAKWRGREAARYPHEAD